MLTVFDHLRDHLLDSLGYAKPADRMPDLPVLQDTEWPAAARAFVTGMQNRVLLAGFRYGRFADPEKSKYDFLKGMEKKLAAYKRTGNTEHLFDLANYAMLEWIWPSHPDAHFRAEDDHHHCPLKK